MSVLCPKEVDDTRSAFPNLKFSVNSGTFGLRSQQDVSCSFCSIFH